MFSAMVAAASASHGQRARDPAARRHRDQARWRVHRDHLGAACRPSATSGSAIRKTARRRRSRPTSRSPTTRRTSTSRSARTTPSRTRSSACAPGATPNPRPTGLKVIVDSFHDRRTAFEFGVNPGRREEDRAWSNDGNDDSGWDAVWDVAVSRDKDGWRAEFRIPFSQLRFHPSDDATFGFAVVRQIGRLNETDTWPLISKSANGFVSNFGDLTGPQAEPDAEAARARALRRRRR